MQSGVRGFTTADQVSFFPDKEKKLIEGGKWPQEYEKEVDMSKVNMDVIAKWIQKRLTELLGVEDDIVVDYCKQQLFPVEDASDTSTSKKICPKKLQINLTGFLAKNASIFVKELWSLLLSAQANAGGVPQQFIDDQSIQLHAKQEEVRKVKEVLEQTQGLEVSDHQSPSRDQLSQSRRRSASRSRPRSFKHSTSRSPCRGQRRRSPLHKGRRPIRDISRNRRYVHTFISRANSFSFSWCTISFSWIALEGDLASAIWCRNYAIELPCMRWLDAVNVAKYESPQIPTYIIYGSLSYVSCLSS